ncbi:MAG: hypothetical protein COY39_03085 [Alphaproteobacteria bacterium CG_4_10_14_0_8_um_filter_37_21]|nr:MAG: hypothetical protein COY39_03085 [Alphaproteobacteria bacterium CG_4_10_14_0_8_um_filter_37_21]
MKKQILIASILCAITTTENYAKHGENFHKTVQSAVMVDVPQMHTYARGHYGKAIEALRGKQKISRTTIINLLENDPYLMHEKTKDGHAKFSHKYFPATFCVQAHNTIDITGATERRNHHEALQVYIDTLSSLRHPKFALNDWQTAWKMQSNSFDNYVKRAQKK